MEATLTASKPADAGLARQQPILATAALAGFVFLSGLVFGFNFGAEFSSDVYFELQDLALAMLVANWVHSYRRCNGGPRFLDEGLFSLLLGLTLVPTYLVASRGRTGFLPGAALFGVVISCGMIGAGMALACVALLW